MQVSFLGSIPIDPKIEESCNDGQAFIRRYAASPTAEIMRSIIDPIAALDDADDIDRTVKDVAKKPDV